MSSGRTCCFGFISLRGVRACTEGCYTFTPWKNESLDRPRPLVMHPDLRRLRTAWARPVSNALRCRKSRSAVKFPRTRRTETTDRCSNAVGGPVARERPVFESDRRSRSVVVGTGLRAVPSLHFDKQTAPFGRPYGSPFVPPAGATFCNASRDTRVSCDGSR